MAPPKHLLKPHRNEAYLAYVRSLPCCITGWQSESVDPAHVRLGNGGGVGLKPSDYRAVPLAHVRHEEQHRVGERTFWETYGVDPDEVIINCLLGYLKDRKAIIAALEQLAEDER